ncbi:putative ribonuclease H-like domain-containing protein [Tanacetum coccineum]
MYEKVKRENERFIPIGSVLGRKVIKKNKTMKAPAGMDKEEVAKELETSKVEGPKENIKKRLGRRLKMKAPKRSKRQKTDSDHEEKNQLRIFLKIVPKEEEKIDYEILGTRYPIINWESKFYDYGHFGRELIYYRVFRADGSSRWIKTFFEMIKLFDRMDLIEIHSLVMKRFETTPLRGMNTTSLVVILDDYLCLRLEDGTEINMLTKRRYPLTKHTLERMMDLRLTSISDDDTVFNLLREQNPLPAKIPPQGHTKDKEKMRWLSDAVQFEEPRAANHDDDGTDLAELLRENAEFHRDNDDRRRHNRSPVRPSQRWEQGFKVEIQNSMEKISNWVKFKKHIRAAFLPYNFERDLYQQFQNLRQGSRYVDEYSIEFYTFLARVDLNESPIQLVNEAQGAKDTLGILFWGVMHKRFGVITP